MCGIAGVLDLEGEGIDPQVVVRMCDQLVHRGPDDEGYFRTERVQLGQRRLKIVDLVTGHQPMSNEDGTVWVTFNGEIYNFEELRRDLRRTGHRFDTESDTEVIVHAYEDEGAACVQRFRGMFAFALWDERRHCLLLARDRVGKKPLFYARAGRQFVFASELQAMLAHPAMHRDVDLTAIDDYLTYGYIPAPKTAFDGINKLLPGHYLIVHCDGDDAGMPEVQQYWALQYEPKLRLNESEAVDGLRDVLLEAVRLRLVADVRLGALLSGGIDSSIVVALMSELSSQPVQTFSIGFDEAAFDELPYARAVAARYGTEHHEFLVRPDALEVLPTLVRHYGEPFADVSTIPSYYVAQLSRQHVTVVLNGDGGDESFAGYERYLAGILAERYSRVPALVRRGLVEPVAAGIPDRLPGLSRFKKVRSVLEISARPPSARYPRWLTYFAPECKGDLYDPAFREQLDSYRGEDWLPARFDGRSGAVLDPLDAMLDVDVRSYLPYDLLVKMDIAAMANSLEARSPFLDHRVMEYVARLPARYKIRGITQKHLLKRLGADLLPPPILRRRKMGFGPPIGTWLRRELEPLLRDSLLSSEARQRGYFRPSSVQRLVDEHVGGVANHAYQLWALLWFELWLRQMVTPASGSGSLLPPVNAADGRTERASSASYAAVGTDHVPG